ncbi:MAG: TetR/AcrR family transcriptional regulator [Bacillota bacterium]|nr:TetR/AcrR family transcriptional regulator [Bacillota bacterium]
MPKKTFHNLTQEKRKRIVNGAKEAFSEKHYNEVTIDTIVNNARISKGSFYQYFNDKDDLFKYMFHDIGIEKNNELIDEINKSSDLSFSDMMLKVIARAERYENKDKETIGLKNRFLVECPQEVKREILMDLMPKSMDLFSRIIEIYIDRGDFRKDFDLNTAAFIFTSVVLNIDKYELNNEKNHGEVLKNICDLVETGMKKC